MDIGVVGDTYVYIGIKESVFYRLAVPQGGNWGDVGWRDK